MATMTGTPQMSGASNTPSVRLAGTRPPNVACVGGYFKVRFEDGSHAWAICDRCRGHGCKPAVKPSKGRW